MELCVGFIGCCMGSDPRGSIHTTIMELGPQNHNGDCLLGPNSIIVVYMDPLGIGCRGFHTSCRCPRGFVVGFYVLERANTVLMDCLVGGTEKVIYTSLLMMSYGLRRGSAVAFMAFEVCVGLPWSL